MFVYQRVDLVDFYPGKHMFDGFRVPSVKMSGNPSELSNQSFNALMSIVSPFRIANGEYYANGGYCKRLKQLGYQNRKEKLEKLRMMQIFLDQHGVLV